MSSWAQGSAGRRPHNTTSTTNPNGGGGKPLRAFRRQPYPPREERIGAHHESESYENVERQEEFSGTADYEAYDHLSHQPSAASSSGEERRSTLYQRFYKQLYGSGARKLADCVVLSVNIQNLDYPKSLGHCLQERGLSVEMLYLQAESGLTRALQDVRSDGSPLCILVEQTNVTLSSCTVIIFSESLKIHRNMPKDQAMEFVMVEFGRLSSARRQRDPEEAAARAAELTDDYLERVKLECHFVPSNLQHLLLLMADGLYLYPEELASIAEYIQNRQNHLQELPREVDSAVTPETLNSFPAGLGKPPPLLPNSKVPNPPLSKHPTTPASIGEPPQVHPVGASDSYPKTKPPPLLSIDVLQETPHRPPVPHGPAGVLHDHSAPYEYPSHGPPDAHGPTDTPDPHCVPAPHDYSSPHDYPAPHEYPHAPVGPHGPPPRHGPPATYGSQTPRGPPVQRGAPAPRGPPVPRSILAQRALPDPHDSQPRQGPPGPHGHPATHGSADHGPLDFDPCQGPPIRHRPPLLRGPSQNGPGGPRGPPPPHGPRGPPPALRSHQIGNPSGPSPRPLRRMRP
ncbi:nuclear receptor coactivator 5 [Hoplias malabaricus]|uniref:nuclear receptor coactivator 5 n=1 Tax=Hoplias malabaricus TaxID=27720 RepID=UPI003461D24A